MPFIKSILRKSFLLFLILLFGINGLDWGLPNYVSSAPDAVVLPYCGNAFNMMKQNLCKYPPLMYVILDFVLPENMSDLNSCSSAIFIGRILSLIFALGTACVIYASSRLFFDTAPSLISSVLFFTSGINAYYSHTTNVEQLYVFFFMLFFYCLLYLAVKGSDVKRTKLISASVFAGVSFFAGICAKDQVIIPMVSVLIVFLLFVKREKTAFGKWMAFGFLIGFLLFALVYYYAGGMVVFKARYNWYFNAGYEKVRNPFGSLKGIFVLWLKAIIVFIKALNVPFLFFLFYFFIFLWKDISKERYIRFIVYVFAVSFFVYLIFFFPFSYVFAARYWIWIVPIVSVLSGYSVYKMFCKKNLFLVLAVSFFILWHLASGAEVISYLKNDIRILNRKTVDKLVKNFGKKVVVGVMGFEKKRICYVRKDGSISEKESFRNLSFEKFGFLKEGEVYVYCDSFPLQVFYPDIVVCENGKCEKCLKALGYKKVKEIKKKKLYMNLFPIRLLSVESAVWRIVERKGFVESKLSLVEQLEIIYKLRSFGFIDKFFIEKAARYIKDFEDFDIEDYKITIEDIKVVAVSYFLTERYDSLRKVLLWVKKNKYGENDDFFSALNKRILGN